LHGENGRGLERWREKEKYGETGVEIRSLKEFEENRSMKELEGKVEYEGTGGKGGV